MPGSGNHDGDRVGLVGAGLVAFAVFCLYQALAPIMSWPQLT